MGKSAGDEVDMRCATFVLLKRGKKSFKTLSNLFFFFFPGPLYRDIWERDVYKEFWGVFEEMAICWSGISNRAAGWHAHDRLTVKVLLLCRH